VDQRQRDALGLGWQLVAEHLAPQAVDDGMEALLAEAVAVGCGVPHRVVAPATLGSLDGEWANHGPIG
jgi:hypothetical protein